MGDSAQGGWFGFGPAVRGEIVSPLGRACGCECTCALHRHLRPGLWAESEVLGPGLASWRAEADSMTFRSFWSLKLCCKWFLLETIF